MSLGTHQGLYFSLSCPWTHASHRISTADAHPDRFRRRRGQNYTYVTIPPAKSEEG